MNKSKDQKMLNRKQIGKNVFYFFFYALSGLMGCVLAFVLSLQFLSPVFSQDALEKSQKPGESKPSNSALQDIKSMGKELKNLLSNDPKSGKAASKTSSNESVNQKTPPPPQMEGFEQPKSVEISIGNNQGTANQGIPKKEPSAQPVAASPPAGPTEAPPDQPVAASPPAGPTESPPDQPVAASPPAGPTESPPAQPVAASPPAGPTESPPAQPVAASPPAEQEETPVSGSLLQLKSYMEPFIYDPTTKRRNPFDDPTQEKLDQEIIGAPGTKKGIKDIVKPPTELYPLKDIELKGIIWDVQSPKALFKLPENQGFYTLLQGDRLGKYGVIEEISEDRVKISETIVKGDGIDQQTEKRKTIKRINRLKF